MNLKTLWASQARRIDAMSLRERALMFVSLAAALVAITDAVALSPRLAEQKALAAQMRQQSTELAALRASLAPPRAGDDTPRGRMLRQLGDARSQLAAVDAEIVRQQADGRSTGLMAVLERGLARHDQLTLVRLAAAPSAAASSATPLPRRGVALALRGSYHDLARYVAETETALPGLRWGELTIRSRGAGAELDAQVDVVGDAR